jgi:hypothetical protein
MNASTCQPGCVPPTGKLRATVIAKPLGLYQPPLMAVSPAKQGAIMFFSALLS